MEVSPGQETPAFQHGHRRLLGHIASVEKNSRVDDDFGRYFRGNAFIDPARVELLYLELISASILLENVVPEYVLEP